MKQLIEVEKVYPDFAAVEVDIRWVCSQRDRLTDQGWKITEDVTVVQLNDAGRCRVYCRLDDENGFIPVRRPRAGVGL